MLRYNTQFRIDEGFNLSEETLNQETAQLKIKISKKYSEALNQSKQQVDLLQKIMTYASIALTFVFIIGVFAAYFEYIIYIV